MFELSTDASRSTRSTEQTLEDRKESNTQVYLSEQARLLFNIRNGLGETEETEVKKNLNPILLLLLKHCRLRKVGRLHHFLFFCYCFCRLEHASSFFALLCKNLDHRSHRLPRYRCSLRRIKLNLQLRRKICSKALEALEGRVRPHLQTKKK